MVTMCTNSTGKRHAGVSGALIALALFGVSTTEAAILTLLDGNGNSTTVSSCCGTALNFDIDFGNPGPVLWDVEVESGDIGNLLSLEGSFGNSTGSPWNGFHIELVGGPIWDQVNRIFPDDDFGFGQVSSYAVSPDSMEVSIIFGPPLFPGFMQIGDPNNTDPADTADWFILVPGTLSAGDHFQLSLSPSPVPIPAAIWLFGGGLIGLAGVARRKRI